MSRKKGGWLRTQDSAVGNQAAPTALSNIKYEMEKDIVALRQFDGGVKLLKIELWRGMRELVSIDEVAKHKITFGTFECEQTGPVLQSVALIATPAGPLLYLDDLRYVPKIHRTKIEIKDDESISSFRILHDAQLIFELFFKAKCGIGLHPYNNTRKDIDFYFWLGKNINDPEFYKAYTKGIKYMD